MPGLIALVLDVTGAPVAIHRTYLRRDGSWKAEVVPDRASLGPVLGGAIRLDPIGPELVLAEGLETAASAGHLLGLPAWSAISTGNLARGLVLPPQVQAVTIAVDADAPGENAAQAAARRWAAEGRRVRIVRPPKPAKDFNDVLMEKIHA